MKRYAIDLSDVLARTTITAIVLLIVVLLCWAAMMRPGRG